MAQEYEVGYRKPPKTTRFKARKSGNPKGRPKGSTNLATDLSAELSEQITVREGGQARRVTKQRALIKSLTAHALQGDVRATTALLALYARVMSEASEAEINPVEEDELLILRRFGPRLVNTLGKKERRNEDRSRPRQCTLPDQFRGLYLSRLRGHQPGPAVDPELAHRRHLLPPPADGGRRGAQASDHQPAAPHPQIVHRLGYPAGVAAGARSQHPDHLRQLFRRVRRQILPRLPGIARDAVYKGVFSATRLNPKKASESEFETTKRGSRLATSVGGTLTGRGGGVLIVDDPIKANDADSEVARRGAIDWFRGTALSRLDNPATSLVCIAMQRLHVDDLAGILIEQGWP